jgi:hypothetical protein
MGALVRVFEIASADQDSGTLVASGGLPPESQWDN